MLVVYSTIHTSMYMHIYGKHKMNMEMSNKLQTDELTMEKKITTHLNDYIIIVVSVINHWNSEMISEMHYYRRTIYRIMFSSHIMYLLFY